VRRLTRLPLNRSARGGAELVQRHLNARVGRVSNEGELVPRLGFGDQSYLLVGGAQVFEKVQILSSRLGGRALDELVKSLVVAGSLQVNFAFDVLPGLDERITEHV
jgi:hypothetical protein